MNNLFAYAPPTNEDDVLETKKITSRDEELAEARANEIIAELETLVHDIRGNYMTSTHDIAVRLYHFIHSGCR